MLTFTLINKSVEEIILTTSRNKIIVLRINIKSNFAAPAVIRPKLEDWIDTKGNIYLSDCNVSPTHIYLRENTSVQVNITIIPPQEITPSNIYFSSIIFSDYENCSINIKLEILKQSKFNDQIYEKRIEVTLPPENKHERSTVLGSNQFYYSQISDIVSMLNGLDVIPSKWLVSELILNMCESGFDISRKSKSQKLIKKLKQTKFFKNGTLLFSGAYIIDWVKNNLRYFSGLHSFIDSSSSKKALINIGENIILNLIDIDIERNKNIITEQRIRNDKNFEELFALLGNEAEEWFLYYILGLMHSSQKMNAIIRQICETVPNNKPLSRKTVTNKYKNVLKEKNSLIK